MAYFSILVLVFAVHTVATSTISTTNPNPAEAMRDFSPPACISTANPNNHHAPNFDFNRAIFLSPCGRFALCFFLLIIVASRVALRIWERLYVTCQFKKCNTFDEELKAYFEYSEWLHSDSVVNSAEDEEGN
jgi:hypothetical protein